MNLRVTALTQNSNAIANIRLRSADLAKFYDQVSSGVRIEKASDDPSKYPALTEAKAASNRLKSYAGTVSESTAVLNSGVSTLQDVNDILVRAKNIALEANDASTQPESREALASEVDSLISRALITVNSRPDGSSLFSGTALDTNAFRVATTDAQGRPATVVYDGADQRARVVTGRGTTVDTRYVGSEVFQQPGADVFASLIALRDDLRGTSGSSATFNQALDQRITDLTAARDSISATIGEQAGNLATLSTLSNVISDSKLDFDSRVGDLEGTDYAEAVVKMQEASTALQAIYAVTAQLADPGLLDFIGR
ncbi:flagellar hook-associated protein FlgL [Gemmata obscuriglobus]|nr:flagellar hook-associated protein FlgL [Gemmata obscuriglobus]QEG29864.1 flagellar hook-associated protein FlgL [Gemmata obscuriglobus]VTS09182.1 flagellar hook-associated protein : Similar to flagellar hook-associated protein FlgL OS=Candidatus Kuenenia stuttgartiensis GN=flgL PE=4 SV=1: Flagellin_N: Flagellin_C [Gemmata obscuriglobus UQM 2246]